MNYLANNIISTFLDRQEDVLTDVDLRTILNSQGFPCAITDIRRQAQSLSPALFQTTYTQDGTMTIRFDPKLEVCQDFLDGRCRPEGTSCNKLHICRHFDGRCPTPNCRFSHDFNQGLNRKIISEHNCQGLDPIPLVKLLRRRRNAAIPSSTRVWRPRGQYVDRGRGRGAGPGRGRGTGRVHRPRGRRPFHHPVAARTRDDPNRQLDLDNIEIEEKLNESDNGYFRRRTIQLREATDVDRLLRSPVMDHHGVSIKFKRTSHTIDKKSFLLKTAIANDEEKIPELHLDLYITTLLGKNVDNRRQDLSSDNEQIILVQYDNDLDFLHVRREYERRPQLRGKPLTLIQIYECDALEIRYNDEEKSITEDDLTKILRLAENDVFAFNFPSDDCAEVEFIHADACKQWMAQSEIIRKKFDVTFSPIIDNVDESAGLETSTEQPRLINSSAPPTPAPVSTNRLHSTTITLSPQWALIATHPKFQIEYKAFIRNELGGEVDIDEDTATYQGAFPQHAEASSHGVTLGSKTAQFMERFATRSFFKLNPGQVACLEEMSATVAFRHTSGQNYLVAATPNGMKELQRRAFPRTTQDSIRGSMPSSRRQHSTRGFTRSSSTLSLNSNTTETFHGLPSVSSTATNYVYEISSPEQLIMFSIEGFEDRLRQHLESIFEVKTVFEAHNMDPTLRGARSRILVKISGHLNETQSATQELSQLLSSVWTKQYDDMMDGMWTTIDEAIDVLHHHFRLAGLTCICKRQSPTSISVHFFDMNNPQFGMEEQQIDDVVKDKFQSAVLTYTAPTATSRLGKEWTALQDAIRQRKDYRKDICFARQPNGLYLFGLPQVVKELREEFEQVKRKHQVQTCQITLSDDQLNYLKHNGKAELNKLEKQFKADGCDISVTRLRQYGDFLAPPDRHAEIRDQLQALAQIHTITFDVKEPGFHILVSKDIERVLSLVKQKCYLEKKIVNHREHIPIPQALAADLEDSIQQSENAAAATSVPADVSSVTIDHSTVKLVIGDLTTQAVDAIVVCSSSQVLRQRIIKVAGASVQQEFTALQSDDWPFGSTSGGSLPCKKIFFVPWSPISQDDDDVKMSFCEFIALAFQCAAANEFKAIAFHAVGCGGFDFVPSTIAKYMLEETRKQLKAQKLKMQISFVLLSDQKHVYDAFVQHLKQFLILDMSVSPKPLPTGRRDNQSTIPYDRKTVQVKLIGSNENQLVKCRQDILALAQQFSIKQKLTDKRDMLDWSQKTIYTYHEFCLQRDVIPTLDLTNITVELAGTKDAVHEAEKYFYELTNQTLKQERLRAVSQGVVWLVESTPNSDQWDQYSYKLNGLIEDAYLKKHSQVEFTNDKEEKCKIVFDAMEERGSRTRRVRRKPIDSVLPSTWDRLNQNSKRVVLPSNSPEYQRVLARFHVTMLDKYAKIVKIERIQNERWYKQYDAHREDFEQRYPKPYERQLFHGCRTTAADQIIDNCFNRSFAGVNGNLYGFGVYFHEQALYSHQYAYPNDIGERTMFFASVLIGKTCKGDATMKTAPSGYDTTTNGQHIFVVYHDAGVYADYLITYK